MHVVEYYTCRKSFILTTLSDAFSQARWLVMPGVRREIVLIDIQIADVNIHIADDGELLMADC